MPSDTSPRDPSIDLEVKDRRQDAWLAQRDAEADRAEARYQEFKETH